MTFESSVQPCEGSASIPRTRPLRGRRTTCSTISGRTCSTSQLKVRTDADEDGVP